MQNPHNPQYGRTAFNGVLRHNDRVNMVQKLMSQYQNVNKQLFKQNNAVEQVIKNIENKDKEK